MTEVSRKPAWESRVLAFVRAALPRSRVIALVLFAGLAGSITLQEVVPQYSMDSLRHRGGKWQNHPSFLVGDCPYYRATLLSLLKDRDLNIKNNFERKQYDASSNVSLGLRNEWYPKHTILMSVAALPFYAAWKDRGLLAFNVVQLCLIFMLIWHGARRYTSTALATALTLYYAFGTCLRTAAYNFAPDLFSTLLVLGGIVALISRRAALAGLLLGFGVWAKWTNVIFLPLAGLYALSFREWRPVLRFSLCAALPIAGLLALNQHMFGSPFVTPYDRVLVRTHGKMVLEASHRTFFNNPFWSGLWTQLSDRQVGLFVGCPSALLAPFGALLLFRRIPRESAFIALAALAQLAVFAKYEQWWASSYGPRFLLTTVALSALLVAPVLQQLLSGYSAGTAPLERARKQNAGRSDSHRHARALAAGSLANQRECSNADAG